MGMANTSAWAALYFILLMTFGNYVLFNLLVAILVEGFSAQAEVQHTLKLKLHLFRFVVVVNLLCICCTTNPHQIEEMEFELYAAL